MPTTNNRHFYLMHNPIQNYPWGSKTALSDMFGLDNADNQPLAEIWMGAHPNGCSNVESEQGSLPLSQLIESDIEAMLGKETAARFGGLPYLFKVLSAAQALSVQVHPNKQQAEQGFDKEQAQGIALNAYSRNYKDPNHKPELVYALTEYQALNGFRSFKQIVEFLQQIDHEIVASLVSAFQTSLTSQGLASLFTELLSIEGDAKQAAIDALLAVARSNSSTTPWNVVTKLAQQYPNDIGLFSPLLLNFVTLQPGEAMFLHACTPHAYIEGTALEVMANSDNVLRAGLTPKHIDVGELVNSTQFNAIDANHLLTSPVIEDEACYFTVPVDDFQFSIIESKQGHALETQSGEIVFAIDSETTLSHANGERLTLQKGQSAFVAHSSTHYELSSNGRAARVYNRA